ncbi:MAG TPA: monofunctional biosynthetic peptidoglycan transglycosylase [Fodinibius sp.]|nr:monofunctional biosynthetic peptidoglycan transglycosylase [Fodinibius sp.]
MAANLQSLFLKTAKWALKILAGLILLSVLMVLSLRWINPQTSSFMLQRNAAAWWNGEENFELYYRWSDWEEINSSIKVAAIASEDQAFADHWGIDFSSINKALEEYQRGEDLRGASTITQQTAKNLFLWPGQSYIRKGIEAYFALLMEFLWPKERILEVYLNIAEFGDGIYGVQAAGARYFNATPAQLSRSQSALMVTALPAPKRYNLARPSGYMIQRRNWVLRYMNLLGNSAYLDRL